MFLIWNTWFQKLAKTRDCMFANETYTETVNNVKFQNSDLEK